MAKEIVIHLVECGFRKPVGTLLARDYATEIDCFIQRVLFIQIFIVNNLEEMHCLTCSILLFVPI